MFFCISRDQIMKSRSARGFNFRKGARNLPPLQNGQAIRVRLPQDKQWSEPQRLTEKRNDVSYSIRNRKFLQAIPEHENYKNSAGTTAIEREGEKEVVSGASSGAPPCYPVQSLPETLPKTLPGTQSDVSNDDLSKTRSGRTIKPVIKYQA